MSVPVFITYRDRRQMLDRCLESLMTRGFDDITIIDNDSEKSLPDRIIGHDYMDARVILGDNRHRQLSPWKMGLVPTHGYYIVMDSDIELNCPADVAEILTWALEENPDISKMGLDIRTDDLPWPPPEHYRWSFLAEYSVSSRFPAEPIGPATPFDFYRRAPVDTHFAMHRPGSEWGGISGARLISPYVCRHLPWYNETYTDEELTYYRRAGVQWAVEHSAGTLVDCEVAVPFSQLRAETVAALAGESVRYAPMLEFDSYWELLRDLFAIGRTAVIVEHDIAVNEGTLDELRACSHDWCAMPYPYRGDIAYGLACTKFSAALMARHPDLIEHIAQFQDEMHPPRHWCRMDAWIWAALTERGEIRHEHTTPVRHLGAQWPQHGCVTE